MSKDELIERIEQYETPHTRRLLSQFSTARLAEYLDYLERMSTPRNEKRMVGQASAGV